MQKIKRGLPYGWWKLRGWTEHILLAVVLAAIPVAVLVTVANADAEEQAPPQTCSHVEAWEREVAYAEGYYAAVHGTKRQQQALTDLLTAREGLSLCEEG